MAHPNTFMLDIISKCRQLVLILARIPVKIALGVFRTLKCKQISCFLKATVMPLIFHWQWHQNIFNVLRNSSFEIRYAALADSMEDDDKVVVIDTPRRRPDGIIMIARIKKNLKENLLMCDWHCTESSVFLLCRFALLKNRIKKLCHLGVRLVAKIKSFHPL